MADKEVLTSLFGQIKPWQNIWNITDRSSLPGPMPHGRSGSPESSKTEQPVKVAAPGTGIRLSDEGMRLALDCIAYPYDNCFERQKRLTLSGSKFQHAKLELQNERLATILEFGQSHYLVCTKRFYQVFRIEPTKVKRALIPEHTFAILLARHHLDQEPLVHWVDLEVPLGTFGDTIDLVTHMKDGSREAWEVVLSASNVAALAARCQGKGFASLWFLCRDHQVRQATHAHMQQAGLSLDLRQICRCTLFSTLLRKQRDLRKARTSGEPSCRTSTGRE